MSDLTLFFHEVREDISKLNLAEGKLDEMSFKIAKKYILFLKSEYFEDEFKNTYSEKQMICVKGVINCMNMVCSFNDKLVTKDFVLSMLCGLDKIGEFKNNRR